MATGECRQGEQGWHFPRRPGGLIDNHVSEAGIPPAVAPSPTTDKGSRLLQLPTVGSVAEECSSKFAREQLSVSRSRDHERGEFQCRGEGGVFGAPTSFCLGGAPEPPLASPTSVTGSTASGSFTNVKRGNLRIEFRSDRRGSGEQARGGRVEYAAPLSRGRCSAAHGTSDVCLCRMCTTCVPVCVHVCVRVRVRVQCVHHVCLCRMCTTCVCVHTCTVCVCVHM